MLLLHGLASSFEHNWREPGWVDLLADQGRTVLEVNLPGHGPGPHRPESFVDMVGDLLGRLPSAVDAIGFSAGGRLLLALAAARPDVFRRLAILGVGSIGREPTGALADAFETGSLSTVEGGPGAVLWRLGQAAGNDPAGVAAFLRAARPDPDAEQLRRITAPVLFVLGEKDADGPLSPELAAAFPRARTVTLRGTDHFATTSDYRCLEAVLDFLDE